MTISQKNKLKKIVTGVLPVAFVAIILFIKTDDFYPEGDNIILLPFWYIYLNHILAFILLILYAGFRMWTDDFFKKNWKKKNYIPLLIAIFFGLTIVWLWHIDSNIRVFFT